jgi:hypothetical protein
MPEEVVATISVSLLKPCDDMSGKDRLACGWRCVDPIYGSDRCRYLEPSLEAVMNFDPGAGPFSLVASCTVKFIYRSVRAAEIGL